jgi:hypothetical protein
MRKFLSVLVFLLTFIPNITLAERAKIILTWDISGPTTNSSTSARVWRGVFNLLDIDYDEYMGRSVRTGYFKNGQHFRGEWETGGPKAGTPAITYDGGVIGEFQSDLNTGLDNFWPDSTTRTPWNSIPIILAGHNGELGTKWTEAMIQQVYEITSQLKMRLWYGIM